MKIDPTGELPEPQNPFAAMEVLNKKDGFEMTEIDGQIAQAQRHPDDRGTFLI